MDKNIDKLLIGESITIKGALKKMGEAGERILFVVDESTRLLGTVTDGDIRRWILKDGDLSEGVTQVYNRQPKSVVCGSDMEAVKQLMVSEKYEAVPVLNEDSQVIDVHLWNDIFADKPLRQDAALEIPVLVMAGGKGTRMDPFTRILPKPLIPLGEKPVIEVIMDAFADHGCRDFYLTVNYKGKMIQSYFDNAECKHRIEYLWEDKPGGTAGSIRLVSDQVRSSHLFVSNCDIVVKADYHDVYKHHIDDDNDITVVGSMKHFTIPYGVLEVKNGGSLKDIVEKPEYDLLVNTGLYLIRKEVIDHIPADTKFDFTDLIERVKERGGRIGVYPVGQHSWIDVGQWQEYHTAVKDFER